MWLREVVFQGVFGLERPAKVSVDPGFCGLVLPEGVGVQDFRTLIVSLLYPARVDGADELFAELRVDAEVDRLKRRPNLCGGGNNGSQIWMEQSSCGKEHSPQPEGPPVISRCTG